VYSVDNKDGKIVRLKMSINRGFSDVSFAIRFGSGRHSYRETLIFSVQGNISMVENVPGVSGQI